MNHPGYVGVPDPRTAQGVRNYREKAEAHPLQLQFLTAEGERDYVERLRDLLSTNRVAEADAILAADLAGFDGSLAGICRATAAETVRIDGWEDLMPILDEFEGPSITGITIGLTNEPDLVFEGNEPREPAVMLGLYSDEHFDFSGATTDELLDQCASDMPGWAGHEEDVEFYVDCAGLGELNTALIQCKHRYFLRDGRDGVEGRAPGGYVEYVLGTWLRATRFLQAVEYAANEHGVPAGAKLLAGTVALHTDFATLVEQRRDVAVDRNEPAIKPVAALTIKRWTPRPDPALEIAASGSALRQKLQTPVAEEPVLAPTALAAPKPNTFSQPSPALVLPTPPPMPQPTRVEPPRVEDEAPAPMAATAQPALKTFEEKKGFFGRLFGKLKGD